MLHTRESIKQMLPGRLSALLTGGKPREMLPSRISKTLWVIASAAKRKPAVKMKALAAGLSVARTVTFAAMA